MNNSFGAIRRRKILDSLERCDSPASRESLLLDRIIELENCLIEMQDAYSELFANFKKLSCVQVPF